MMNLMKDAVDWALNLASLRGVTYADARVVDSRARALTTKNGKVGHASDAESFGIGIRAIADGAWGFAASDDMSRKAVEETAAQAVAIAKASARVKQHDVRLAPEKPATADWATPIEIDPFTTSIENNLDLLLKVDSELRAVPGITLAEASMNFQREESWFGSTEGANIHQTKYSTGTGYTAYAFAGTEIQKRSYPNSFGGQWQSKGYELIDEWKLVDNARRIAEETVALHKADQCPEGVFTIILDSSQLGLQIHESIGHPIELDRVLGMEANFAGTRFLTLDKLRTLRYGSDLVNAVADATPEHGPGLGTFAFDDEGVPAQSPRIIRNGLFPGYLSSRETAARHRRATIERHDARRRLEPPAHDPHDQHQPPAGTKAAHARRTDPVYRRRHPHADQQDLVDRRQALQLPVRLRNRVGDQKRQAPQHAQESHRTQASPQNSGTRMDAICSRDQWTLWGTPNCGKGQPQQVMGTGHGASPARFRNIKVGTAYKGSD